jgi:hypothetical protein
VVKEELVENSMGTVITVGGMDIGSANAGPKIRIWKWSDKEEKGMKKEVKEKTKVGEKEEEEEEEEERQAKKEDLVMEAGAEARVVMEEDMEARGGKEEKVEPSGSMPVLRRPLTNMIGDLNEGRNCSRCQKQKRRQM